MKSIHKYQWPRPGECKVLSLPLGAQFVATGMQEFPTSVDGAHPQVWVLVDINDPPEEDRS